MEKINAVIIDDEIANTVLLEDLIDKFCPLITITGKATTRKEAKDLIDKIKPKLIFLDIELDEGTAFDLIEEINHKKSKIIFVTSHSDYAIKAFKYNAIDYVLKPVKVEQLVLAVNRAYTDIEKELYTNKEQIQNFSKTYTDDVPNNFIAIPSIDKIVVVKLDDIVYLKSDGRYTIFHLTNGSKLMASRNLGEYESIIDKSQFFRVHNSYMVNLKHVLNIHKKDGSYCEMINGEYIPIAKRRQNSLNLFLKIK
jgi:two-component system LytT family response regulator